MTTIRLLFNDQLSESISCLRDVQSNDVIVMFELMEEATNVWHHPKKLAFIYSATRHFAQDLSKKKYTVKYMRMDDPNNSGTFSVELERVIRDMNVKRVVVTAPNDYRLLASLRQIQSAISIEFDIREDDRFLCSIDEFKKWSVGKKQLRMEYFYRAMRKKYKILMTASGTPIGGSWNYDKENRKAPNLHLKPIKRISHQKDNITNSVLDMVEKNFSEHFGTLRPFNYAVTRTQALIELDQFIDKILYYFGDYQDAMLDGEPYLYHSLISSYLNIGLLLPLEVCRKAEKAYYAGKAPLNAVEGFIRQILGWREFVRGIYWLHMPKYAELNFLNTSRPLPKFYWDSNTKMYCLAESIRHTRDHAYSHHIQRLMVTGNFALLAGFDVRQVQEWYLAVYSDAFEWVEMPNTLGMALFGDGGVVGSKPYAASGKYINKMSNYCDKCPFDPNATTSENACPFNSLYWDFFARNEAKLNANARLPFVYSTWKKFGTAKQKMIRNKAAQILLDLENSKI